MTGNLLAGLIRLVCGANLRCAGFQPAPRQRVYFANHTSHLDALLIWSALPPGMREVTRPVAALEYWTKGPIRRWLSASVFHCVLIDRTKVTVRNNPIVQLVEALGDTSSLILFPEGTRSVTGEVGAFKGGLFHLARHKPELEFVPVYVDNLNRILPKGEFLPVPMLSSITFGAPLTLLDGESKPEFMDRARTAVLSLRNA